VAAFGVPAGADPGEAAALGKALAAAVTPMTPVGLLVMADLSARRTQRAPASFHPGAEEFDRRIGDAIRKAELGRLLDVDPGLAAEMGAGGMAALWLLAGALGRASEPHGEVLYEGGPFGVGYLVGVIEAR
jgi:aromatic ring-opening dioxygenase LigB subunit